MAFKRAKVYSVAAISVLIIHSSLNLNDLLLIISRQTYLSDHFPVRHMDISYSVSQDANLQLDKHCMLLSSFLNSQCEI